MCCPISKWAMGAWLRNPSDLVAISDVESDPRIDDAMRQQLHANGRRSLALLPLYSRAHRTWQGDDLAAVERATHLSAEGRASMPCSAMRSLRLPPTCISSGRCARCSKRRPCCTTSALSLVLPARWTWRCVPSAFRPPALTRPFGDHRARLGRRARDPAHGGRLLLSSPSSQRP